MIWSGVTVLTPELIIVLEQHGLEGFIPLISSYMGFSITVIGCLSLQFTAISLVFTVDKLHCILKIMT